MKKRAIDLMKSKQEEDLEKFEEDQAKQVETFQNACLHKWVYDEEDRHDVDWWHCTKCDMIKSSRGFLKGMPYPNGYGNG